MIRLAQGKVNDRITIAANPMYPGYIVRGETKSILIDPGLNLFGPLYLKNLGETLGNPDNLDYILATHSHYDHLGAVPYLKRSLPDTTFASHPRISELLRKESVLAMMNRLSNIQREMFRDITGDEDVTITGVEPEMELRQGDEIDLGGLTCQVFETPGHTRDSLSFFIPEMGALFPGEAAGIPEDLQGLQIQVEFLSSYSGYLNSIDRMIDLAPKIIRFGHGWVYDGGDATGYLERSYRATDQYRHLIESYLDQTDSDEEKALEIMTVREYDERGTIKQERNAYMTNLAAQIRLVKAMRVDVN